MISCERSLTYDTRGNITFKAGPRSYIYNQSKINRLDSVSFDSTSVSSADQYIEYNSDNLATLITQDTDSLYLTYGADGTRIKTCMRDNGALLKTKYFSPGYEKEISGGTTRHLNYIYSPFGLVALIIKQGTTETLYYIETDHLGSIISLINTNGTTAESYSYDAWGRRRNPTDLSYNNVPDPVLTDRGYTGHEHLDKFDLINMNGRLFDPFVGRFLNVDPFIQSPENAQSYAGYNYCLNNPLGYSDPTGKFAKPAFDPGEDNRDFYSSIEANSQYLGYLTNVTNGTGGKLGADWDKYMNAVHNGFTGTVEEYESGIQKKVISLGPGKPTIVINLTVNTEGYSLGERAEMTVLIYGSMYEKYNFVQTVFHKEIGAAGYLEWSLDRGWQYNHGFYYLESDIAMFSGSRYRQGSQGFFRDAPNVDDFSAELTICGLNNGVWKDVETISWGYSIIKSEVIPYYHIGDNQIPQHQINVNQTLNDHNSIPITYPIKLY